jgi:hypothetical protein
MEHELRKVGTSFFSPAICGWLALTQAAEPSYPPQVEQDRHFR